MAALNVGDGHNSREKSGGFTPRREEQACAFGAGNFT